MSAIEYTARLIIGICLAALSFLSSARADTSLGASVSVRARTVSSRGGLAMELSVIHTFSSKPSEQCLIRLYGLLSGTDGASLAYTRIFRIKSKRSFGRRVRFSYQGPAIRLTGGRQTQLNLQTASSCPEVEETIYSSPAAVNVTCTRGVSGAAFIKAVKVSTRSVRLPAVVKRSAQCQ